MVELMSYGLSSLIATLAVACYLAFDEDFVPAAHKPASCLLNNGDLPGSPRLIRPDPALIPNDEKQTQKP
jgi:hypothetical protein